MVAFKHIGYLIRRCSLPHCERHAEYILVDGRVICHFHLLLLLKAEEDKEKVR